jgi:hypothetical protein
VVVEACAGVGCVKVGSCWVEAGWVEVGEIAFGPEQYSTGTCEWARSLVVTRAPVPP